MTLLLLLANTVKIMHIIINAIIYIAISMSFYIFTDIVIIIVIGIDCNDIVVAIDNYAADGIVGLLFCIVILRSSSSVAILIPALLIYNWV